MKNFKENLIKNWASFLGGFLTVSIGFVILIGWYLGKSFQDSMPFHFLTVQFFSVIALIVSGAALTFLSIHFKKLSRVLAIIGGVIACLATSPYLFSLNFGVELLFPNYQAPSPVNHLGRMALATAIALILANLSILLFSSKNHKFCIKFAILLSAVASIQSLLNLTVHLSNVEMSYALFNFSRVAILNGLMCFILNISIFIFASKYFSNSKLRNMSLPISMIIGILAVTLTLWQTFRAQEHFSLQKFAQQEIGHLQYTVNESIKKEFEICERIADRWEVLQDFSPQLWNIDAERYIDQSVAINEIALYNKDLKKEKTAVKNPDSSINFSKDLSPAEITRLKEEKVIAKPAKNKDFLSLYFPLVINREFYGFVALELNLVTLLKHETKRSNLSLYRISLYYEDTDLFTEGLNQPSIINPIYAKVASEFGHWKIKLELTQNNGPERFSSIYNLILITGFFIAALTGSLMFVGQSLNRQRELLQNSNVLLKKSSQQADEANAAKGTFLATMSHEIRTPLNAVIGTAELLQETNTSDVQKKYLNRILSSSILLLELIGNILDFSKIEAGNFVLQKVPTDFLSLIKNVADDLVLKNTNKNLDVFIKCPSTPLPKIILDPVRMQQILSNLGNNALKFTEEGHLLLCLTIKEQSKNSITILFEVEDTGIGISKENQEKIFTKFTQVEETLSRKYGGVGLGLSICKKLVKIMDGEIGVSGEEGKGSTFWIELAFETADKEEVPGYSLKNKSILLLNDKKIENEIIEKYLADWGATVTTTPSTEEHDITIVTRLDESFKGKTILICDAGEEPDINEDLGIISRPILPSELYKILEG